jgi:polar amino acid transport system permease protein
LLDFNFLVQILPTMMKGLRVTVLATLGGYSVALIVGLVLAIAGRSRDRAMRAVCKLYIDFVRCTPLLVQLYFAFYILPSAGIRFEALTTGILVLGLNIGAYVAEIYRSGIEAVHSGQWEAARSLGLTSVPIWVKVILPQALPPMLPPLGNTLIGLFKETPLLAAITVVDLFGSANGIAGLTYRYTEPYTAAAIILLAVSLVAAALVRRMEQHFQPPKV